MKVHSGDDGCDKNPSRLNALEHQVYLSWFDVASGHGERAEWTRDLIQGALSEARQDWGPESELEAVETAHACDPRRVQIGHDGTEFHGYSPAEVKELLGILARQGSDAATWSSPERGTCDNCGITLGLTAQYEAEQEEARVRDAMYAQGTVSGEFLRKDAPFMYPAGVTDLDSYDAQTILEGGSAEADAAAARMDARRRQRVMNGDV
jgi:hypothetical protein